MTWWAGLNDSAILSSPVCLWASCHADLSLERHGLGQFPTHFRSLTSTYRYVTAAMTVQAWSANTAAYLALPLLKLINSPVHVLQIQEFKAKQSKLTLAFECEE